MNPLDAQLDDLVSRHLDGRLTPDDESRLRKRLHHDAAARRRWVELTDLHAMLAGDAALAGEVMAERDRASAKVIPHPEWQRRWIFAAAAAALLLAAIWFWSSRNVSGPLAHLTEAEGEVTMLQGGRGSPAVAGERWAAGERVQTGGDGGARLVFADATRLGVGPDSTVYYSLAGRAGGARARSIVLENGEVALDVTPQPKDAPLKVLTADAEVNVVGTRLRVSRLLDTTLVEVSEGKVEVVPKTGGAAIAVNAGYFVALGPKLQPREARPIIPQLEGSRVIAHESYGTHSRNVLNLWVPPSDGPVPLVVFIPYRSSLANLWDDPDYVLPALLHACLHAGLAVATIDYRRTGEAVFPAQMHDCGRALQHLRWRAREWNLDPRRVALVGDFGAGSLAALWLAYHDDLAQPDSADPVARESTRVAAVGARGGRTSVDPRFIAREISGRSLAEEMRRAPLAMFGLRADEADTPRAHALYDEASPNHHLTADDPPAFLFSHKPLAFVP